MSYDTAITIYPTEDLKERIERAAEAAGLTTSRFVTDLLAKKFPSRASVNPVLMAKAVSAAEAKFKRDGCEVREVNWDASNGVTFNLVVDDGLELVFVLVDVREAEMPSEQRDFDRSALEVAAGEWLSKNPCDGDVRFRFDSVCLAVIGEDGNRALLRHHRDFLGPWRG